MEGGSGRCDVVFGQIDCFKESYSFLGDKAPSPVHKGSQVSSCSGILALWTHSLVW